MRRPFLPLALLGCALAVAACDDSDSGVDPVDAAVDMARDMPDAEPIDAAPPPDQAPPDAAPDAAPPEPPAPPSGTVTQLAGDTGSGFVDGVGSDARFAGITCIALSPDGDTLYASDTFNGTVRAIDLDTRAVTTLAGRPLELGTFDGGPGAARLTSPRGCAATDEALFVADGPTLRRVDFDGTVTTLAGQSEAAGAIDGVGRGARLGYLVHDLEPAADGALIYISDRSNDAIRTLDPATGEVATLVGPAGRLDGPGGLARLDDVIYVADTFDGQILRLDPETGLADVLADGLDAPQGVAVDGRSAFAAGFDGALYQIDLESGAVTVAVGVPGETAVVNGDRDAARLGGSFAPPVHDAARKRLYYVDLDSGGIRVIDTRLFGVSHFVGPDAPTGYRDGPDPRFGPLYDVVPDPAGGWIVSDPGNAAVRAVSTDGEARTLFGSPADPNPADGPAADARIDAPVGLAWRDGRLVIADYNAGALRAYDPAEQAVTTLAEGFVGPWGLGAGPDGAVWLTDADTGGVSVLRPDDTVEAIVPPGTFEFPVDVAVDPADGAVYVADAVRAAVYRLDGGEAVVVAGQPGETGVRDGPLDEALLGEPLGLTFAPDGGLLVVDGGNHLVRRIDLAAGTIQRWLGHPVRHGGRPAGAAVPWDEATFERPQAAAVGPDGALAVVADAALSVGEPEDTP